MADERSKQLREQQMSFKDALACTLMTMGMEQLKPKQVILPVLILYNTSWN